MREGGTTEDFREMVEKHMTPEMRAVAGGKMDYANFDKNADGDVVLKLQSNAIGLGFSTGEINLAALSHRGLWLGSEQFTCGFARCRPR